MPEADRLTVPVFRFLEFKLYSLAATLGHFLPLQHVLFFSECTCTYLNAPLQ